MRAGAARLDYLAREISRKPLGGFVIVLSRWASRQTLHAFTDQRLSPMRVLLAPGLLGELKRVV